MIPTSKNFIIYDEDRNVIPLPAEYYGDAIKKNLDGTEESLCLTQTQLNQLGDGVALSDPSILPLAKYGLVAESIYIPSTTRNVVLNDGAMGKKSIQRNSKEERDPIRVVFKLFASSFDDFSLKSSLYRAFLNNLEAFYIADSRQPFKLYKVMINEPIEFDQPHYRIPVGECALNLIKVESIFAESLHTTLDIDREGVRWNDKWGYGMGLSSDVAQWRYTYISDYSGATKNFSFFNAGTEDIKLIQQKESSIKVVFNADANWFEIFDGDKRFRIDYAIKSGDVLEVKGHRILLNGKNVAGSTNRVFLTIRKGMNNWEFRGPHYYKVSFDFRFLYD